MIACEVCQTRQDILPNELVNVSPAQFKIYEHGGDYDNLFLCAEDFHLWFDALNPGRSYTFNIRPL